MSREDDGFLSRWARRKAEARQAVPPVPQPAAIAEPAVTEAEAPVDLTLLPALEDIGAATDITGFLQKGVPDVLRNAALRRMWETDVAIRDYIGPADFQWDFNTPGTITGYGELVPGTDIGQMVRDIAEHHLKPPVAPPDQVASDDQVEALAEPAGDIAVAEGDGIAPETGNDTDAAPSEPMAVVAEMRSRRRHGGATPQ